MRCANHVGFKKKEGKMSDHDKKKSPEKEDKVPFTEHDGERSIQDQRPIREKFERPEPWPPPPSEKDND